MGMCMQQQQADPRPNIILATKGELLLRGGVRIQQQSDETGIDGRPIISFTTDTQYIGLRE